MNFEAIGPYSLTPWALDSTKCPCDEGQFLQAVQYLSDNPNWINREDATTYCKLLVETRTPNTEIGMRARRIQNVLFQDHPLFFDLITCRVEGLQIEAKRIPKVTLEAMSDLFKTALSLGMREECLKTYKLIPAEEGVSQENYAQFLEFLALEEIEITKDNVFALMHLAERHGVSPLEAACSKFIIEKLDLDDIEVFSALVELVFDFYNGIEYVRDLKWRCICYASEHLDNAKLTQLLEHIEESKRDDAEALLRLGMDCKTFDIKVDCKIESPKFGNRYAILKTGLRGVTLSSNKSLSKEAFRHLEQLNTFGITGLLVTPSLSDQQLVAISNSCGSNLLELHCPEYSQVRSFMNCSFPKLIGITIRSCHLTNEGLEELCKSCCHSLQELNLDNCEKVSTIPVSLCSQLVRLGVIKTNLTNKELQRLGTIIGKTLQELRFGYCIQIHNLERFEFSKLKKLEMNVTNISSADLRLISDICGDCLEELNIERCDKITTVKGCRFSKLVKLKIGGTLSDCPLDDDDLQYLSDICSNTLRELDMSFCQKVTTLIGFKLVALNAEFSALSDAGLLALSQSSGDCLEVLNITLCNIRIFKERNFTCLRQLKMHTFSAKVTNEEMQALSRCSGDTLEELNISGHKHVTLEGCRFVKLIRLGATMTGITNKALQELCQNSRQSLKELRIPSSVSLEGCQLSEHAIIKHC